MSSLRGRRARRRGRHRHHRQPQPVDRQRLQGQVADRVGGRPRDPARSSRRRSPRNGGDGDRAPAVRRRRGGRPRRALRPVSRATSATSGGRSTSTRSRRPTSSILVEPMYGAGAGWIPRLLAGGRIRVTEIHQERNPFFGGVNPEPIRPNIDEALGDHRRRRLRPGPAARRRRRPGRRGRRAGHVHPPARGHRPADVLPRRAPRAARAGRRERQQHVDGGPARRALRDRGLRDAGRLQVHRPEDDRDRGDDGRRGVGRVRLRDAPAGARRRSTPTCCCSTCSSREKAAGRWPVSKAIAHFHEIAGPVVLPADRRPRRPRDAYAEIKRRLLVELARTAPTELAGQPVVADAGARHERRLQVLRRRRLVAAGPDFAARSRSSASTRRRRPPSCAGAMLAAGERLVRGS